MREQLDCALLSPGQSDWATQWHGAQLGGRLVLHAMPAHVAAVQLLDDPAMQRGRYDAGLIHVHAGNLADWRTALAARTGRLPALLLAYAEDLRPQAVEDLMLLGVADFVQRPFSLEELRVRIGSALRRLAPGTVHEHVPVYGRQVPGLAEHPPPAVAWGAQHLQPHAGAPHWRAALEGHALTLAMRRHAPGESFREAKLEVVACFESAYLRASLARFGGNITQAARWSDKHRRAFWAMMRKYDIDPEPYRNGVRCA